MRESDLFIEALQKTDPADRIAYLDAACVGDEVLRGRVLQLLVQHEKNESFLLDAPAPLPHVPPNDTIDQPTIESPGTLIGPYKLVEPIGEGGMGSVWMAQQSEPVKRLVALKLIKPGMDSKQVIARFEAERQALALMDHPNIAKVLDGGTTSTGRPYFVMDLVKGVPITKYCDEHHLTPRQRLELFLPVCQAVQHAHQKGVIHRDIKPSNVLVALYDGKPVPKVIDFGLAKAVGQPLTDQTLVTGFGNIVGTLEYMSPEQAEINQLDIDTRSDIYSLGVLLYELLTGSTPFSKKDLEKAGLLEMLRVIREQEPSKPSTKLSSSDALPTLSANRGTEPAKLTRMVRGELDWIVMKALEKDRGRRYETANGFAMDVQRYMADEPVAAGPPSVRYRLRKFVRRNRGQVLAFGLVFLVLLGGVVGTTWGMVEARRRAEGERQAKERAEANFAMANDAVDQFLVTVTGDPQLNRSDFTRLRKRLLDSAIPFFEKLTAQKGWDPQVEAGRGGAYRRLGTLRKALGENEAAVRDFEAARDIFARLSASFPADRTYRRRLAESLEALGEVLHLRLGKHAEAEAAYRECQGIIEKLLAEFPKEPTYHRMLATSLNSRAGLFTELDKRQDSEPLHRKAVAIGEKLVAEFPKEPTYRLELARSLQNLALLLLDLGKRGDAEEAFRKAIAIQAKLVTESGDEHEHRHILAVMYTNLASVLRHVLAKREEAAGLLRQAIAIREKLTTEFPTMPAYRRSLATTRANLASLLEALGKREEAVEYYRHAIAEQEELVDKFRTVPVYRLELAKSQNNLGTLLSDLGKLPEAEAALRQAIAVQEKLAAEFPTVSAYAVGLGGAYCNFGRWVRDGGQPEAALPWYQKAITTLEPVVVKEPRLANAREFLRNSHLSRATALDDLERRTQATRDWERAMELDDGSNAAIFRLRISRNKQDAAGCLAAASALESLKRTGANDLYEIASYRAICAAVIREDPKTLAAHADRLAREQADLAMARLHEAVTAGFKDARLMKRDKDLDVLRGREDFKRLLAELGEK